jgi:RND superfamily putative drug exporter
MSESTPKAPKERSARKFLVVAILVIIGWFALSGATGPLFGKLSTVQKNDTTSFLPGSAESTKAFEISTKFTAQDSSILPALVIFSGDGSAAGTANVMAFAKNLGATPVPGTEKTVNDYLAANAIEQLIPIPAQDGKGILLSIPLDNNKLATPLANNKPALPEVVTAIREQAASVPGFTETHVTGFGGILADLFDSFGAIDTQLLLITFAVVLLILIVVYRSPLLCVIVLFCSFVSLGFSGGLVYLLAKAEIIDLDGQSQGILSVLVIGASTDYALLLIARYREEFHQHADRIKAMKIAWRGVVEPIVASGLTVIAGLAVLSLSDLKNVRSLGPVAGIGILAAQMVMLSLLPALLVVSGQWVFWNPIKFLKNLIGRVIPKIHNYSVPKLAIWPRVANLIGRHPRRTWLASGGILLIAAGFAFSLNTGGLAQTESFTTKPDSVVGLEVMSKHFPAGSGDPTLVVVKQADMAKVAQAVTGTTGVSSVVPTMDPASVMAGKPAVKVVDGWARLELTLDKPADSLEAQAYIPGIREVVHNASETALVGGTTPTSYDIQQTNKRDRDLIIPVALLVIGLILALLLRSIVAPILLIITTVLSFAATLGVCHLVFKNVFHFKATDGSFPLFAFVFLVALGIDYNIFLMTRVREEAKRIGTRPGILKGVTVTGGVITSAGVVLAATFAVLGTLPLVFLAELGFAVAFGVLLDTIVVRSLLVPALSYELDKKIWWPSKLAKVDGADA